jgi:trehalose-6-phosphatase
VAPQKADLVVGKLEHEVGRETLDIALDRAIERLDGYFVERSQLTVEHHLLPAQNQDGVFDVLRNLSAVSHSLASNPRVAPDCLVSVAASFVTWAGDLGARSLRFAMVRSQVSVHAQVYRGA